MDKGKMVCRQQRGIHSRKSAFVPAPEGTLFLWDVANLIGEAGPDQAANLLDSISASLLAQGYQSMFGTAAIVDERGRTAPFVYNLQ